MTFGNHKENRGSRPNHRVLRTEVLEERALLSAVPLSDGELADLAAQYASWNLPVSRADLNVITLDLAEGDDLADLKSAIAEAGATTKSDLIVVRTSEAAHALTYAAATDEIAINIDSTQFGSISIVSLGTQNLTLDASQFCRVMSVSGSTTVANLGGLTVTNGKSTGSASNANYGGGIYNRDSGGTLMVASCTISGNTASIGGGGIYNYNNGTLTLTNSTVSGNSASNSGGGICNFYNSTLTVTDSTISGNTASYSGGGIYNYSSGTLTLSNSIISMNHGRNISGSYSGNNNIIDYNPFFVNAPVFDSTGKLTNAEMMDLHLRSDSRAINAGDNSQVTEGAVDMEGHARIYDETVDIGAYEYQGDRNDTPIPYSAVVDTLNDSFDSTDGEWSLREAIYWMPEYTAITFAEGWKVPLRWRWGNWWSTMPCRLTGLGKSR